MSRNAIESVMGAVVLLVAGGFVFFADDIAQVKAVEGYEVTALFYKIGRLNEGRDVRISGHQVGPILPPRPTPLSPTYGPVLHRL